MRRAVALAAALLVTGATGATSEPGCSATAPCANFGSCNLHTGGCACPLGYGGRTCERVLLPACVVTSKAPPWGPGPPAMLCASGEGAPEHGQVGLKSCECLRQCVAHEGGGLGGHGLCFERPGGAKAQHSAFPAASEAGVKYHQSSQLGAPEVSREEYMKLQTGQNRLYGWEALPPSDCSGECSGEGVCLKDVNPPFQPTCWCAYGFTGAACETPDPKACLNGCAGHGRCLRGFCSCALGWFGIDCSVDLAATEALERLGPNGDPTVELDMPEGDGELTTLPRPDTASAAVPAGVVQQRLRPAVYVYELPTWLAQAYEIDHWQYQTERGMYSAYWHFLQALLADGHVRTLDPWKANLFYIPAFTYAYTSNGSPPHDYIRRILRFIAAEYPALWARRGGRDHIVWATGDRGMCPLPADLSQLIWLVHFGQLHASPDDAFGGVPNTEGGTGLPLAPDATCFVPSRGIVAPPYVAGAAGMANTTYGSAEAGREHEAARPTLLFFAGSTRMTQPGYSQGVRQRVWQLFGNRSSEGYAIHDTFVGDMLAEMRRSRFCLAPSGHGWGIRIVHAMAAGCVPLILQDGIHQPFDDVLPYHEFALRLPQADVERLDDILRSVTPGELRALQAGVRRFHTAFVWSSEGGEGGAYAHVLKSLHRRLQAVASGF